MSIYGNPFTWIRVPGVEISIVLVEKNMITAMQLPTMPATGRNNPAMINEAAATSVKPIRSEPRCEPKTLKCQLNKGLLVTSGVIASDPGLVILKAPAHNSMKTIPAAVTIKGMFFCTTHFERRTSESLFILFGLSCTGAHPIVMPKHILLIGNRLCKRNFRKNAIFHRFTLLFPILAPV